MPLLRWLVVGSICALTAAPVRTDAQARDEDEDSGRGVMRAIFGPNWHLFLNAGPSTSGRLMLQGPAGGGERALKREDAFNLGVGAGVDVLARSGLRLAYVYTSGDLAFRTDDGDGSSGLDVEGAGELQSHVAAIDFVRYWLHPRARITPFGSAGFVAAWWVLDDESPLVTAPDGSTQFRFGALASLGLQFRLHDRMALRVEATSSSVRNPFTGRRSFVASGGATIDEPTRVNTTDFRFAGVYYLGDPDVPERRGRRGR